MYGVTHDLNISKILATALTLIHVYVSTAQLINLAHP